MEPQRPEVARQLERARMSYRLRRMTRGMRRADIRIYASVILTFLILVFALLITVGPAHMR